MKSTQHNSLTKHVLNGNASVPPMFLSQARLEELLDLLQPFPSVLILTHDNPDPDAIASAACLRYILSKRQDKRIRIGYGGIIGRAENRAMMRLLRIHAIKITESILRKSKAIVMVDTQPHTGNSSLPADINPLAVIDHHPFRKSTKAKFIDVRPSYGAGASILTEYLFASGLDIPTGLATALFYAISSETQDLGRDVTEMDKAAYIKLLPKTNWRILEKIRRPALDRHHFAYIAKGIANAYTYKNAVATSLGKVEYTDIVAQVAEMLLGLKRISWALCTGRYRDSVVISVRTNRTKGRAATVARRVVGPSNTAGGHDMIAGGQIDCTGKSEEERDEIERKAVESFFRIMGKPESGEPAKLVPLDLHRTEPESARQLQSENNSRREEVKK